MKRDPTSAERFMESYDEFDDRTVWFDSFQSYCPSWAYAPEVKPYRHRPKALGLWAHSDVLRAVTARTPPIYTIWSQLLGKEGL